MKIDDNLNSGLFDIIFSTPCDLIYKKYIYFAGQAHSTPITCGQYLNSHDICTCTTLGQIGIWDMRAPSSPARLMMSSDSLTELWSVDHHPSQSHILAAGGSDGLVTFFDVRNENSALAQLLVHSDDGKFDIFVY